MKLFKEINTTENKTTLEMIPKTERPKMIYEKLNIETKIKNDLPLISQYFLALFVLVDSNGILDIPFSDSFSYTKIIEEIAPHFNYTIKITSDSQTIVRLKNVKENSINHFSNLMNLHLLSPVIYDLYAENKKKAWEGNFTIKEYEVNLEMIEKENEFEISLLWDFLYRTFIRNNGHAVLLPNGWEFNDSFKDRIAVQSFSSVCNSMTIIVNVDTNLISSIMMN